MSFAIRCTGVSKKYSKSQKHGDLRSTLSALYGKKEANTDFWALKDINFTIEQGDTVGIIGRNGAGKSTLLKLLSKITHPTKGNIKINGRLTSLLEVGTGFHPQLTGRENIFLNGSLLGMTRDEIKQRLEEIVEFSGVSEFIDMPVKHYSSGMYVRLAFSVAAHLRTDILLVDEVLAVGDTLFQEKSLNKMNEVVSEGRTVLLVSHNLEHINALCKKVIFLNEGRLDFYGKAAEGIQAYSNSYHSIKTDDNNECFDLYVNELKVTDTIYTISGQALELVFHRKNIKFEIDKIRLIFSDENNNSIFVANSEIYFDLKTRKSYQTIHCQIPKVILNTGIYFLEVEYKKGAIPLVTSRYKLSVGEGNYYGTSRNISTRFKILLDHQWKTN